jgi:hypothetical protein
MIVPPASGWGIALQVPDALRDPNSGVTAEPFLILIVPGVARDTPESAG